MLFAFPPAQAALPVGGSVFAWGYNCCDQSAVPPFLTNVVAVAAGSGNHSLALKDDGSVAAWGQNWYGECDVPTNRGPFAAVAAGSHFSLALQPDGQVAAWGNFYPISGMPATVPTDFTNIVAIAAGSFHWLALRSDGTVRVWGYRPTAPPEGLSNVIAIAAGNGQNLALRQDGTVASWSNTFAIFYPVPEGLRDVSAISASYYNFCARRSDGTFELWGDDSYGQLTAPAGLTNVVAIEAGGRSYVALKPDMTLVAWGHNYFNQTNIPALPGPVAAISNGGGHILAVVTNSPPVIFAQPADTHAYTGASVSLTVGAYGSLPIAYQWQFQGADIPQATNATLAFDHVGLGNAGNYRVVLSNQFGTATSQEAILAATDSPPFILTPPTNHVGYLGKSAAFAIQAEGSQPLDYQWRFEGTDIAGATNSVLALTQITTNQYGRYSVVVRNACGTILSDQVVLFPGLVFAWGGNANGQTAVPSDLSDVVAVAAGAAHSLVLRADGTVVGWGSNGYTESMAYPWITNVVAVAAGNQFSLALRSNGTVVAWGDTTAAPPAATNIAAIAAGPNYRLLLGSNGIPFVWGWLNPPTPPKSATNLIAIAAGAYHSLGLRQDGSMLGWGNDYYRQATIAASATDVLAIAAGGQFSLALRADGMVIAWGENTFGQTNVPPEATNIVSIAANQNHAMALRSDGRVLVWGDTNSGQAAIPKALTFASAIAAGSSHDLALLGSGDLSFFRQPLSQSVLAGHRALLSASALGRGAITYQWMRNGTNVPGATEPYYAIPNAQDWTAGDFQIVIANSEGSLTSALASVSVVPSVPVLTLQPAGQEAPPHSGARFVVDAIGTEPMSFQWTFNGIDLPGATHTALTLENAQVKDSGDYRVVISNGVGTVTSRVARLEIYALNLLTVFTNTQGSWSSAWADYDNDGWLDLLVGGKAGSQPVATPLRLFRNHGDSTFTEVNAGFNQSVQSIAWGDFDNDGYQDIVATTGSTAILWRNSGNGGFSKLSFTLPIDSRAAVSLADFNRDGLLDILLGGRLYQNWGGNQFTNVAAGLPAVPNSTTAWADYDQDGLPDVFICGNLGSGPLVRSGLFRNLGNGTFTNVGAPFADIHRGGGAWLDFDQDSRQDLLLSGQTAAGYPFTGLYRNAGNGTFTAVSSGLPETASASLAVGDYDNDGQPDVFLSGNKSGSSFGGLYRIRTDGTAEQVPAPFPINFAPVAAWGDYDRDGRLDLALSIQTNGQSIIGIYRSESTKTNSLPLPPSSLSADTRAESITFRWNPGSDPETPEADLSYNVRVGRTPGAGDMLAPGADTNGLRRVVQPGNAGNATGFILPGLPFGRYYWAVQTLDSSFAGSPFTPEHVLTHAVLTLAATGTTSSGATLNGLWNTNLLPGTGWFEWGNTTNYGHRASPERFVTNANGTLLAAPVSGLLPDTTYYFRLMVTNAEGIHPGEALALTTTDVPQIAEVTPGSIRASQATVNALVNPKGDPTTVWCDYGLTTTYGASSPGTNFVLARDLVPVSLSLTDLIGGQVYHYRVAARNNAGTTYSGDFTFTTTTEPEARTWPASAVEATSVTLNGAIRPNTLATEVWFEYGATTNLGQVTLATNIGGGTNLIHVASPLTNLNRLSPYAYRVVASNAAGLTRGGTVTFSTTNDVIALPATQVQMTSATLAGLVNPNGLPTTVAWQYGPVPNFDRSTPPLVLAGATNLVPVTYLISNLLPDTVYGFRLVATNAQTGRSSLSLTFQTSPWFSLQHPGLPGVINGASAWGDFDNDGYQDFLITGPHNTRIYRNLGDGHFAVTNTIIPGTSSGWVAWGDYNNDGWLDVLIVGASASGPLSRIYRNNGDGTFTDLQAGLAPLGSGVARWGDFNNDGRPDVLLVGEANSQGVTKLYRNEGNGAFTDVLTGLPAYLDAYCATADYNLDGWLDILLMGRVGNANSNVFAKLFRNVGNGIFQDSGAVLAGARRGFADWGDVDEDGYPDLLLGGLNANLRDMLQLYRNNGNGTFSDLSSLVPAFAPDAALWADYDNDGRLDILIRGQKNVHFSEPSQSYSAVLRNNGTNAFSIYRFSLPEIWSSAGGSSDYDHDGRLEVLITGNSRSGALLKIYENNSDATNHAPLPPLLLSNVVSGKAATLSWAAGSDWETPPAALAYSLRVGRLPSGFDVVCPLADTNGMRRLSDFGNLGQARTFLLTNLAPGKYYWSVQAVDTTLAGSVFAPEQEFLITGPPLALTLEATGVKASAARLNGVVDAGALSTEAFFEWGSTTNLGMATPGMAIEPGASTNSFFASLTNLLPGTAYFFRAVATNALAIAYGQIHQFETAVCPVLIASLTADGGVHLLFDGTGGLRYQVLASTNLVNWNLLGEATASGLNHFHFMDSQATNCPTRFYRILTD